MPAAELRQALASRKKTELVDFLVELVKGDRGVLWTFTIAEAWAWSRAEDELVDRSTSPWDDLNAA